MSQIEKVPEVTKSILIHGHAPALYQAWETPETRQIIGGNIFNHASTLEKEENKSVHWRSEFEAEYPHDGTVEFKPAANQEDTEVTLTFRFPELLSASEKLAAKVFGYDADTVMEKVLQSFKTFVEAGANNDTKSTESIKK